MLYCYATTGTKRPQKASVSVDGAGIVSVQSKDVLRSSKGRSQLKALKKVPMLSNEIGYY